MSEIVVLLIFCGILLVCVVTGTQVLYAIILGLALFFLYGMKKGVPVREMIGLSLQGVKKVGNILITFVLIGMLTALWRSSGTIAAVICYCSSLIHPRIFLLIAFLLNCVLSVLTGTSFGTVATMGVICMSMGRALGLPAAPLGGAILAGIFFGDRCSPMSTSAQLVCAVTDTDIYANIRGMIRTAAVPFALSCLIYLILGAVFTASGEVPDTAGIFRTCLVITPVCLVPAALVLILSLLRLPVKRAMGASILAAFLVGLLVQGRTIPELIRMMLMGFYPQEPELAALLSGGGVISMVKVGAIVCFAACYAGIFERTGLLVPLKAILHRIAGRTTAYTAVLVCAVFTCMIACNQTLAIMLTDQLTMDLVPDAGKRAVWLEDTCIIISALIPWSIACATPLSTLEAPTASIAAAVFLYLVPLWGWGRSFLIREV